MSRTFLACLLVVVALPLASARPNAPAIGALGLPVDPHPEPSAPPSHEADDGGDGQNQDAPHDANDDQGKDAGPNDESTTLEAQVSQTTTILDWTFHGQKSKIHSFNVYRATNGAASDLIATLNHETTHFEDPDVQTTSAYSYSVQPTFIDGSSGAQSNSQLVLLGMVVNNCPIVSVGPGNPPVLIHPECAGI